MRKEKRAVYNKLIMSTFSTGLALSLCAWCKYAEWEGYSCTEMELDCQHPIDTVKEYSWDAWSGDDCWGFKPKYDLATCADYTGLALQGVEYIEVLK